MENSFDIQAIKSIRDRDILRSIIEAAQNRLEQLEKNTGSVSIVCRDNTWYALLPDRNDSKRVVNLGEQLTPAAVLKRSRQKPPTAADYEITKSEAIKRQQVDRENVGWWEDGDGRRRYYDVAKYDAVRDAWHKWERLAKDPVAMSYRISVSGMKVLRELEDAGYQIIFYDKELNQ